VTIIQRQFWRLEAVGAWTAVALPAGWPEAHQVVCTSPSFCLATAYGDRTALWDGSTWGEGQGIELDAVDCVSSTSCVAVTRGHTWLWSGTVWSSGPDLAAHVLNISCGGVDDCWAGTTQSRVAHFDGSGWSQPQVVTSRSRFVTVSCTATACFGVDGLGDLIENLGHGWVSGPTRVGYSVQMDCATTTCTVVLGGRTRGQVMRWNGTAWSRSRAMPAGYSNLPQSVSCPTDSSCFVVDEANTAGVRR